MASAVKVREMREVWIFGVGMVGARWGVLWLVAAGANAGAFKAGGDFALSCAGIIQIRYEGTLSPGNNCFQDP